MYESTIEIPGFQIAYKSWGQKKNPPLIALHGWLDNANSFELLAPLLAKSFYVIAIDLPGHGLSSHLPDGCYYHFSDSIFTIVDIINAFHFEKVHLLGHSMGACIASLIGGVVHDKIASLVFIEALGPFSAPDSSCASQLEHYLHTAVIHKKGKFSNIYPSLEFAAEIRAKKGYLALPYAKIICQRGLLQNEKGFSWRHDRRLLHTSPLRMTETQVLSCLKNIKAPAFYIAADNGFSFDKKILTQRIKTVPNLKTVQLSGGHHIHMEKFQEVGDYLKEFYKGLV